MRNIQNYLLPSRTGRGSGVGLLLLLLCIPFFISCNDEWTEEQYEQYISFKAPLNDNGVTAIYVPYTRKDANGNPTYGVNGLSHYELPVLVSGTTDNEKDLLVQLGHSDTLAQLNYERFGNPAYRADIVDLYYKDMDDHTANPTAPTATYPSSISIPKGQNLSLLKINFDFRGVDMVDKWVLPIEIKPGEGYQAHPRKNYAKAMLRVYPYNDYSGNYSATTLTLSNVLAPGAATGMETARAYVADENTVFFYAGNIDESRVDRHLYKIFFRFVPSATDVNSGTVVLSSDNAANNLFADNSTGTTSYEIYEQRDDVKPWLMHHYVIIKGINYNFTDYTSAPTNPMGYNVKGTLTLERQLNTQIPDEDQAIQW